MVWAMCHLQPGFETTTSTRQVVRWSENLSGFLLAGWRLHYSGRTGDAHTRALISTLPPGMSLVPSVSVSKLFVRSRCLTSAMTHHTYWPWQSSILGQPTGPTLLSRQVQNHGDATDSARSMSIVRNVVSETRDYMATILQLLESFPLQNVRDAVENKLVWVIIVTAPQPAKVSNFIFRYAITSELCRITSKIVLYSLIRH